MLMYVLTNFTEVPEILAYKFPTYMADLKCYSDPADQVEVCATRSFRILGLTTSYFSVGGGSAVSM